MNTPRQPDEIKLVEHRGLRTLWLATGILMVVLGVIGIFLPVMPTTPFLIVAAACFARSSPRFYDALVNHPVVGPPIRQWRATGTIPKRVKILAISLLVVTLGSSIVFFVPLIPVKIGLALIGLGVITWMLRIPNTPEPPIQPQEGDSKS